MQIDPLCYVAEQKKPPCLVELTDALEVDIVPRVADGVSAYVDARVSVRFVDAHLVRGARVHGVRTLVVV